MRHWPTGSRWFLVPGLIVVLIAQLRGSVQSVQRLPTGARADLFAWSEALRLWKEEPSTAEYELARGVLFECVAHASIRSANFGGDRPSIAGQYECVGGGNQLRVNERCHGEAEKAFKAAARLDPSLTEAEVRLAGLKIETGTQGQAHIRALEVVAKADTPRSLRYVATMFLGHGALMIGERDRAIAWFTEAREVNAAALSAQLAATFAAGKGTAGRSFFSDPSVSSSGDDDWYTHRCRILDPRAREILATRIAALPGRTP